MSRQVTLWAAGSFGDIKGAVLEAMLQVHRVEQICQPNRTEVLTHFYSCNGNCIRISKGILLKSEFRGCF
jgi:hypothetical protein